MVTPSLGCNSQEISLCFVKPSTGPKSLVFRGCPTSFFWLRPARLVCARTRSTTMGCACSSRQAALGAPRDAFRRTINRTEQSSLRTSTHRAHGVSFSKSKLHEASMDPCQPPVYSLWGRDKISYEEYFPSCITHPRPPQFHAENRLVHSVVVSGQALRVWDAEQTSS